jgi:hypothetical protein
LQRIGVIFAAKGNLILAISNREIEINKKSIIFNARVQEEMKIYNRNIEKWSAKALYHKENSELFTRHICKLNVEIENIKLSLDN